MEKLLEKELRTYEEQKSKLLGKSKGKFALVKDDQVIDVFENRIDAIRQGYERFGNVPFLTKKIVEIDIPQNYTSSLLGV